MLFLDKISVGSLDSGAKGERGAQPGALARKQHAVLGLGRAMHFDWHRKAACMFWEEAGETEPSGDSSPLQPEAGS